MHEAFVGRQTSTLWRCMERWRRKIPLLERTRAHHTGEARPVSVDVVVVLRLEADRQPRPLQQTGPRPTQHHRDLVLRPHRNTHIAAGYANHEDGFEPEYVDLASFTWHRPGCARVVSRRPERSNTTFIFLYVLFHRLCSGSRMLSAHLDYTDSSVNQRSSSLVRNMFTVTIVESVNMP